eukprot:CAMPEP_0175158504 /NCGR_PEP_ID=MMETSP0087-20121206/22852_1 /TAXON_ID=136419 /ORGANISM="Unknown Unknown, Strain D1" /LENGTH=79 /DNA_ID=CAMNT_0016446347 /DNA_START=118 /DNA_END=354 /DNA_ORIENTATION=+
MLYLVAAKLILRFRGDVAHTPVGIATNYSHFERGSAAEVGAELAEQLARHPYYRYRPQPEHLDLDRQNRLPPTFILSSS